MNAHLSNRTIMGAGIISSVLALASAGCGEQKKAPPPPPPTVLVATVSHSDLPLSIEAVASIDGYVNADIRARVRGFLKSQDYKDGAAVKKGDLLFTIDPSEWAAALSSAQATLARAQAAQQNAKVSYDRVQSLVGRGVVSKQEMDNATASQADSNGQVEAARAQVQQASLNLGYTRITAPNDGVAGVATVRVGNLVGQDGPTLLTTVSQIDPIRVNFPISEIDYVKHPERFQHLEQRDLKWAQGQFAQANDPNSEIQKNGVDLVLADGKTYKQKCVIVSVNRQVDATTGTIGLQALCPNPESILRPGQYGRVRIKRQGEGENIIAVQEKALINVQGSYNVAIVGPDNKVAMRKVELGPAMGGMRVVSKGLNEGDKIVVEGTQKVQDGVAVNPQPAPPPAPVSSATPMGSSSAGSDTSAPAGSASTSSATVGK